MTYVRVGDNTLDSKRKKSSPGVPTAGAEAQAANPYTVSITQKFKPRHGLNVTLHEKPPTPTDGGGGWEEVELPRRGAVLVWKGLPLMKMTFSVVFDDYLHGGSVMNSAMTKLLAFWRPVGDGTTEPSVLELRTQGDILTPFGEELSWVISNLEWLDVQGDNEGNRTQQILGIEVTEWRPDQVLQTASQAKTKATPRTEQVKVKKGQTLAKIAKEHGITAAELGALQKPKITDGRVAVGRTIIVPVGHHTAPAKTPSLSQRYGSF